MKRIFVRFIVGSGIAIAIVAVGFAFWVHDRYAVPILTYHHVGDYSDKFLALNTISTRSFEYQIAFLKKHGYHVISFDDLVQGIKKGYTFTHNTVVLHFDDGYEDNYTNAFSILKKYQLPAMVFLVSDKIGSPGFLSWAQIKEMERYNFLAGAHTRHHAYLPHVSLEMAKDEIAGSKRIIEQNLGHPIDYFVYPAGGFTSDVKDIVRGSGFRAAATTNRGKDRLNQDLFELKRIRMNEGDDRFMGLILWSKFSGYYNLFRKSKDGGGPRKCDLLK